MTGAEADENERSLHPGPDRDQMVPCSPDLSTSAKPSKLSMHRLRVAREGADGRPTYRDEWPRVDPENRLASRGPVSRTPILGRGPTPVGRLPPAQGRWGRTRPISLTSPFRQVQPRSRRWKARWAAAYSAPGPGRRPRRGAPGRVGLTGGFRLRSDRMTALPKRRCRIRAPTDPPTGDRGARPPNSQRQWLGRLEEAPWLGLSARRSPRPRFGR
jgi:hypothetical protein